MTLPAVVTLAVLLLASACFLHPFITYPLSLRLLPQRRHPVMPAGSGGVPTPSFTLLFCAHNEITCVADKLTNLEELHARNPGLEVLAYDDASTDGTAEVLAARPDLLRLVRGAGRTGKAHGMKLMAAQSTGDVLVFTDANVMIDVDAFAAFANAYEDAAVGGVSGRLLYTESSQGTATETVGGAYWRLEENIKELESRSGNVMGADGSIFSVRRRLYPDFPDTVQDDFTVSMSVVVSGFRLVRRADAVARETLVTSSSEEFRRKVRIAARAYHTHLHLRPGLRRLGLLDRYKYVSHKLLRWHSASFLVVAVVAALLLVSMVLGPLGVLVASAGVLSAITLVRLVRPRWWTQGVEIVLALVATNWGAWQALRGRTYQTWKPPSR